LERRDRTTNREITIFSEIPGDVTWIFPASTIFVETKRRAGIEKATNEKKKVSEANPGRKGIETRTHQMQEDHPLFQR
jgi:hypothetical protein